MQSQTPSVSPGGYAVEVNDLTFKYTNKYGEDIPALEGVNLQLKPGSRCLLLGSNGAGKTTLLRFLAGKHLHEPGQILVLGKSAFYQTLGLSGISYLGNGWTKTVAFAGNDIPMQADLAVRDMANHLQDEFPERRDELVRILEIDLDWRLHQVSAGQRRRVQIMLGLLRPFQLLLCDEMTVDLDICGREDFLLFLQKECEERGATVIYTTHIFDQFNGPVLKDFPTDIVVLEKGKLIRSASYADIQKEPDFTGLYGFVSTFLRKAQAERKEQMRKRLEAARTAPPSAPKPVAYKANSGYSAGRLSGFSVSDFLK